MVYPASPLPIEVGFNLGGTWTQVPMGDAVTGGVLERDPLKISYGRANWAGEPDPARLGFTMRNNDGRYSPGLVTGLHYPLFRRNTPVRVGVGLGDSYLMRTGLSRDMAYTTEAATDTTGADLDLRAEFTLWEDLVDIVAAGDDARVRLAHRSTEADGWEWELYNANGYVVSNLHWVDLAGVHHDVTTEATGTFLPHAFHHDHVALRATLDISSGGGAAGVDFWNVYDVDNSTAPPSPIRTTSALGYFGPFPITRSGLDAILNTWVSAHGGTTRNVASAADWTTAMAAAVPGDLIRITANIPTNLVARGSKYGLAGATMTTSPAGGTASLPIIITCADGVYIDPNNQSNNVPGLDLVNTSHVWAIGVNVKRSQFGIRCTNLEGTSDAPARIAWCDIRDLGHSGLIFQGLGANIAGAGGTPPVGAENAMGFSAYIVGEANTIDNMGLIASQFGECVYMGDGSNEWMSRAHHIWLRYNTLTKCRSDYVDIKPGCHQIYVYGNTMTQGCFHFGAGIQILYGPLTARPTWYDFDPEIHILFNRIHDGNLTTTNASSSDYVAQASLTGVRFAFNQCWGFAGGGIGFRLRGEGPATNARSSANEKWWIFNNLFWTSTGVSNGGAPAVSPVPYDPSWIDARNNLGFTTTTNVQFTATSADFTTPGSIPAVGAVGLADSGAGLGSAFDMAAGSSLVGDGVTISDVAMYIDDLDISQRTVPATGPNPGPYMVAPVGGHTVTFWTSDDGTIDGTWVQLGAPVVLAGATTVKTSTAPLRVGGNPGDSTHQAFPGAFHDFELRHSIGGALIAQATFTALAVGTTAWTDSVGNDWNIGVGGRITNMRWRFHGELSEIPVRWDLASVDHHVPLEAAGLFRRLRQGDRLLESALRRATIRQAQGLVQYWPLEETGAGLSQFGAAVGTAPFLVYQGANPKLGANTDFPSSAALPEVGDTSWATWVDSYTVTDQWQVRWLMSVPDTVTDPDVPFFRVHTTSGLIFELHYDGAGGGGVRVDLIRNGTLVYTSGFVGFAAAGIPMYWHLECTTNGANVSYQLLARTVGGGAAGVAATNVATDVAPGAVYHIIINQQRLMEATAFGHVTLQNVVTPTNELQDGLTAWDGELAVARIKRLCLEEGVKYRIHGDPFDSEPMGPQRPLALPELLAECAQTDGGILSEARESVAVAYRTRASINGQTPLVLNYSGGHLVGTPQLDWDDDGVSNDVTVSTVAGGSGRAVLDDESPMSITEPPYGIGRYARQFDTNGQENRALDLAGWRLRLATVDEPRVSNISTDTNLGAVSSSPTLTQSILGLELGDLVEVTALPSVAITGTIRQIVQGVRETIGLYSHRFDTLTTSATPWDVRLVDVDARYDTASSILAAAATAGATSISVATLLGPAWTTAAGDLPLDIRVNGIRLTVTAIGAVSGGLQTFTLSTPLPRALDVGFPIGLADPTYFEL